MTWLVICRDAADSGALRQRHLKRHLAYVETVMNQIAVAGPMAKSVDGEYAGCCHEDREEPNAELANRRVSGSVNARELSTSPLTCPEALPKVQEVVCQSLLGQGFDGNTRFLLSTNRSVRF